MTKTVLRREVNIPVLRCNLESELAVGGVWYNKDSSRELFTQKFRK